MPTPEIAEDIAKTAEAMVDAMHLNPDITFAGILAGPTIERLIAEALAAERERCAVVARCVPAASRERVALTARDNQWVELMDQVVTGIEEGVVLL